MEWKKEAAAWKPALHRCRQQSLKEEIFSLLKHYSKWTQGFRKRDNATWKASYSASSSEDIDNQLKTDINKPSKIDMTLNIYNFFDMKVTAFIFIIPTNKFNDTYLQYETRILIENWDDSVQVKLSFN